MKSMTLVVALMLTGCSTVVPVAPKFPESVPELTERCPELQQIQSNDKPVPITEMLKTVVNNYNLYYKCSNKVDGWNKWYEDQKKIYESIK